MKSRCAIDSIGITLCNSIPNASPISIPKNIATIPEIENICPQDLRNGALRYSKNSPNNNSTKP